MMELPIFIVPYYNCPCQFVPSFPAESPYVTTLGGTQGAEQNPPLPEISCTSTLSLPGYECGVITSGGGFSYTFETPKYQKNDVKEYLRNSRTPTELFCPTGRGFPDVSLNSVAFFTILGGEPILLFGTSISAPAFAAMVTLMNAERQSEGKPVLGFLNPALYKNEFRKSFNDITVGNNNCVSLFNATEYAVCCPYGFDTTKGWDPTTGLGTINFEKLKSYLLKP